MARRDLSKRDASDFASSELEYVISTTSRNKIKKVTAEEAMTKGRVVKMKSNRDITRVLFVSQNAELLNPTQQTLDGYVNISDLFDEVHVLILRQGIEPRYPVLRVSNNVWLYTVSTKFWWHLPQAGLDMIDQQLEFASGFRPDLIVARDPYESAIVAYKAGEKFKRATQLHIIQDYTDPQYRPKGFLNFFRRFIPRFTIPQFISVRTQTSALERQVSKEFAISDLAVLPKYQNYEQMLESTEIVDLKEKYKPHIFFMGYMGKLNYESSLHRVLDAAKFVLKNPRVALIVLGDGPARGEFERKAKALGIDRQVIFVSRYASEVPYLKSLHMLLVSDTDFDSEEVALKGAAAGTPLILSRTEKRMDIFTHNESAFICEPDNTQAFTDRIDDLLNNVELREKFSKNAQDIIRHFFHADPEKYRAAYRSTIEQAFFAEPLKDDVPE